MSIENQDNITAYEQTPDSIKSLETQKKDETLPSAFYNENDTKAIVEQKHADKAKIQEIRESLGFFVVEPVIKKDHVIEAIEEVMLDDLFMGGNYKRMIQEFSKNYHFDYHSFASQVRIFYDEAIKQGENQKKAEEEAKKFAQKNLHELIERIWENRKNDLEQWSALLDESIEQNYNKINTIGAILENFYNTKFKNKTFSLKLAPHPQKRENIATPSKNIGEAIFYVPHLNTIKPEERNVAAEGLIIDAFHEMSHQQLQDNNPAFYKLVEFIIETNEYKKVLDLYSKEKGKEDVGFVKEAVTNYIDAYLNQFQFHKEKPKAEEHKRDVYTMGEWINTDLASEYFSQGKQIDHEFMRRLFRLMQE